MRARTRRCLTLVVSTLTSVAAQAVSAQDSGTYPARPIRMIVANPPGGGTDIFARLLAQKMSERWKQSVVVDNRAGASETVGADIVAKATADGYTLIMLSSTHTITPSLFAKIPYDPINDFATVTQATMNPYVMGAHPSVPAKSVQDFVAFAKANPGALNYASGGSSTAPLIWRGRPREIVESDRDAAARTREMREHCQGPGFRVSRHEEESWQYVDA